jgi:hypothetical protein
MGDPPTNVPLHLRFALSKRLFFAFQPELFTFFESVLSAGRPEKELLIERIISMPQPELPHGIACAV